MAFCLIYLINCLPSERLLRKVSVGQVHGGAQLRRCPHDRDPRRVQRSGPAPVLHLREPGARRQPLHYPPVGCLGCWRPAHPAPAFRPGSSALPVVHRSGHGSAHTLTLVPLAARIRTSASGADWLHPLATRPPRQSARGTGSAACTLRVVPVSRGRVAPARGASPLPRRARLGCRRPPPGRGVPPTPPLQR
jgi:hypothetical protein